MDSEVNTRTQHILATGAKGESEVCEECKRRGECE